MPLETIPAERGSVPKETKEDDEGDDELDEKLLKGDGETLDGDENSIVDWTVVTYPAKPLFRPRSRSSSSQILARQRTLTNGKLQETLPEKRSIGNGTVPKVPEVGDEYDLEPPDGGWGWMVLLGTVIVNTLIPGLIKSFGVLYVEILTVFNATPSAVAWIPALTFALYNLLGPVASVLSTKVSCRFATCVGGFSATLGLALSYFANSIEYLYFSYGILGGIGAGMSYTPGVLIVGQYFNKRRGFANGICASGSALGSIILPPFLNYLLVEYGFRGAILIMCGLIMNVCVGAALYRPVQRYLKKVPKDVNNKDLTAAGNEVLLKTNQNSLQESELAKFRNNNSFANVTEYFNSSGQKRAMRRPGSNPRFAQNIPDGKYYTVGTSEEDKALMPNGEANGAAVHSHGAHFTIGAGASPTVASYTASTTGLGMGSSSGLGPVWGLHRSPSVMSTVSSSSFAYLSTIYHGSTPAAYQLNQIAGHRDSISESRGVLAAMTTSQGSIGHCTCDLKVTGRCVCGRGAIKAVNGSATEDKAPSTCKLLFDLSLIKNTVFLLITYTVVASGIGYTNLLIVLPAYADAYGLEKTQYALLLSIIAGADLVGRIGGATLSDIASFPCKYLYMAGFAVSGLVVMIMPRYTSFEWLAACCAVFGFASGIYIGLMAVLLVNHLGADKLASSFGLSLAVNGVVMMGGPPIIGAIREVIGSYEPVLFILGAVILSGGLILFLEPLASRHEKQKLSLNDTTITMVSV